MAVHRRPEVEASADVRTRARARRPSRGEGNPSVGQIIRPMPIRSGGRASAARAQGQTTALDAEYRLGFCQRLDRLVVLTRFV